MTPGEDHNINKILVAVDLSPDSEKTAAYAVELARPFGAYLSLIHVCAPNADEVTGKTDDRFGEPVLAPQEKLEELAKKIRRTYPRCSAHLCVGDPADKLAVMAEILDADLILVGNHHPNFLGRLLELDQTERILHQAPCSVLVFPSSTSRS
jgi:nucleotide-binding universal stress UspA family protein